MSRKKKNYRINQHQIPVKRAGKSDLFGLLFWGEDKKKIKTKGFFIKKLALIKNNTTCPLTRKKAAKALELLELSSTASSCVLTDGEKRRIINCIEDS